MVELAVATSTSPRDWWDEDDTTLATALEVVSRMYQAAKR